MPGFATGVPGGDVAVRERGARRNRTRDLVDPPIEWRHALHVEGHGGKVDRLAMEQRHDPLDGALHGSRRRRLARLRKPPAHARLRLGLGRLRQLDADHPMLAPRDPAAANRRIEQRKPTARHDPPTLACSARFRLLQKLGELRVVAIRAQHADHVAKSGGPIIEEHNTELAQDSIEPVREKAGFGSAFPPFDARALAARHRQRPRRSPGSNSGRALRRQDAGPAGNVQYALAEPWPRRVSDDGAPLLEQRRGGHLVIDRCGCAGSLNG